MLCNPKANKYQKTATNSRLRADEKNLKILVQQKILQFSSAKKKNSKLHQKSARPKTEKIERFEKHIEFQGVTCARTNLRNQFENRVWKSKPIWKPI
jgi:hypothetical protein